MFDCYYMYYLELKSTINTSFSFPQPIDVKPPKGKTYMIKYHQIKSLLERSKFPHIFCGLLLDFADRTNSKGEVIEGGCYFIEINTFVGWARSIGKASINQKDAKLIGIKVDRTKKIVNYTYDIRSMCDNIIRQYL